jgi:hypothetical protein
MSLMDKIKSFFSGGSAAGADDHAGHDHSGHDHSQEPAGTMPPAEQGGMPPMSDPGDEDRPA